MITVLVVDDSKFMAKQMRSVVEGMGFQVASVAHDGFEGVEQFQSQRPAVTLLDITMPNMDGIECLQQIRAIDPEAGVVMVSAIRDQATIDRCLEIGANGFLQKPIRPGSPADLARLCEAIENAAQKVC